jgi:PBP1b-binding outer membrane lipoprotein LpoB
MQSRIQYAIILLSALLLGACRQGDGPVAKPDANAEAELDDVKHDLQNVARRDPSGPEDLRYDVTKYARRATEAPAIDELSRRTASVIAGKTLDDQTAARLAHSLWTSIMAREISERQVEALQNEMQSVLMSAGVAEPQAQQVAAQVGVIQKQVSNRPRRWYELF